MPDFKKLPKESVNKINLSKDAKQQAKARNKKIWTKATSAELLGEYFSYTVPQDLDATKFKAGVLSALEGKNLKGGNLYDVDVAIDPENKPDPESNKGGAIAVMVSLKALTPEPEPEPDTEPNTVDGLEEPEVDTEALAKAKELVSKEEAKAKDKTK